jgi:hypothetical protein
MNTTALYKNYKLIIEKIFSQFNDYMLKSMLFEKFNNYLEAEGYDKKSLKTLDRIIEKMIEEDYEFLFGLEGHKRIIKLNFTPNKLLLNKNEMNAFPLIFGNMQTEDELPTVKKIKELVSHEYGFKEKDLIDSKYFVKTEPEINNHGKIILLAGKLISYAKKGIAVKYWYKNKQGIEDFKYIAPLQIRLYDSRYYLLGLDVDSETGKASDILKNYSLDTFLNYEVGQAYYESVDGLNETKVITFDHDALYKKSELNNKLKHSIGIWYDPENQLRIFKIKFYDWAKGIVLNKKLHYSQKVIENKANYVTIQLAIWDNHEIDFILGRFGDKCERLD